MPTSIESYGKFFQIQIDKQIILQQFSGIRDRDGTEIYEKDVVRRHWDSSEPEDKVVVFRDGSFMWGEGKHATRLCSSWAEIVGNVCDGDNKDRLRSIRN